MQRNGNIPDAVSRDYTLMWKENPWLSLAQGIVLQAITDWRVMTYRGHHINGVNYTSLRQFFRSPWCENLLLFTNIDPLHILAILEKELEEEQP